MRCKKHLSDQSSSVGVCASCLRERLMAQLNQLHTPEEDHHTPQLGPTFNNKKFSLISNLFRSRSDYYNSDPRVGCPDSTEPSSSYSSPSSWFFSTIFPPRKSTPNGRRGCRISNRGMSPNEDCDRSPWSSRGTPMRAVRRTRTTTHGKNVSGLAFCLSPLVRASPNRHWNQKGGFPPELVYSGEVRSTVKPHLSTAASFCANRSRKLADFGRVNHNR